MTDKVKARIIGPCEIAGAKPGGMVDLDPSVTNIKALERSGHIRIVPAKPAKADKDAKAGDA